MTIFRRDTPAEAEFRMTVRTWLEANLPVALRGRTARPPPAELMPWYRTLSRKGWIAPHWPKAVRRHGRHAERTDHHDRGTGARRRAADAGSGAQSHWPDPDRIWHRRSEGATSAAHHCRYGDLGAGLFRARRRLRSRQPCHPGNARRRSFRGPGAKNMDHMGSSFATGCSRWCAPIRRPSRGTPASVSC